MSCQMLNKKSMSTLCNFLCGLHSLVHMAEVANASIIEAEKCLFDEEVPCPDRQFRNDNLKETGACRLVRTACKAFARGADEKNGCYGLFKDYVKPTLDQHKFHSLPLKPYRGNRFNILIENAKGVFFLFEEMVKFLQGSSRNRLLKSVLYDLQTEQFVAGVKALALVSTFVTEPLWRIMEDKTINIIDMSKYCTELSFFCKCNSKHAGFHHWSAVAFWSKH